MAGVATIANLRDLMEVAERRPDTSAEAWNARRDAEHVLRAWRMWLPGLLELIEPSASVREDDLQSETVDQLLERARVTKIVAIAPQDRREFARALVLQGYDAPRAHRMAYDDRGEIKDNDGALQMLARHRLAMREGSSS
jgi:hypothetical protein